MYYRWLFWVQVSIWSALHFHWSTATAQFLTFRFHLPFVFFVFDILHLLHLDTPGGSVIISDQLIRLHSEWSTAPAYIPNLLFFNFRVCFCHQLPSSGASKYVCVDRKSSRLHPRRLHISLLRQNRTNTPNNPISGRTHRTVICSFLPRDPDAHVCIGLQSTIYKLSIDAGLGFQWRPGTIATNQPRRASVSVWPSCCEELNVWWRPLSRDECFVVDLCLCLIHNYGVFHCSHGGKSEQLWDALWRRASPDLQRGGLCGAPEEVHQDVGDSAVQLGEEGKKPESIR